MQQFKMPQLGETVLEATVTRWLKRPGDPVQVDEPLVEVSTDKVDSEIPSPIAGFLTRVLVQEGETVLVGAAMAEIDADADGSSDGQVTAPQVEPEPAIVESPEKLAADKAPPPKAKAGPDPQPVPQVPNAKSSPPSGAEDGRAEEFRGVLSPLVRKLASEHGVDLTSVSGTGAGGRITKQDVVRAASEQTGPPAAVGDARDTREEPKATSGSAIDGPGSREQVVQVGSMRKAIAEHMVSSVNETARAWNTIEVDLTRVARIREQAGPGFKNQEGFSLTWMPFVSKALTQALLRFPQMNSTWNGDGTVTLKRYVNLGVAVALDNGLIVPVVKGTESMNLMGLARGIRDVADRARSKKLTPDDVQGGTFTITNPGGFGSIMSMAIINRGQSGILAFDAVVKRPVVVTDTDGNDAVAIRNMAYLSVSWDHRVIDGAQAAQFLSHLKGLIENADFAEDLTGLLSG